MSRIISPLNIASLIFLIVIFICWDKSNRTEKREQRLQEETEYVNKLRSISTDQIIERINSKMPLNFNQWMNPTFQSARFENDTLVFRVTGVNGKAPFATGYLSLGASDPHTGTLTMIAKAFSPDIIDYITLNDIGLKIEQYDLDGQCSVHWTMTHEDVFNTYTNHHYLQLTDAPLRDYLLAGGR